MWEKVVSMEGGNTIILTVLAVLVILLVGREIVCWYFKINERRNLLRSILSEMRKSNGTEEPKSVTEGFLESLKGKKRGES